MSSRLISRAILQSFNFEVDCAEHGQAALDALDRKPYELLILDGQMPLYTGREVAARIRDFWTPSWRRPRIIALSADNSGRESELWRENGVDHCIAKPLTAPVLHRCLRSLELDDKSGLLAENVQPGGDLIDWKGLDQLHNFISPERFKRIFTSFVREITDLLEDMRTNVADVIFDRQILHKLKGLLGFMFMSGAVKLVKQAGESGGLRALDYRMRWLSETIRVVNLCINEIVARYSISPA